MNCGGFVRDPAKVDIPGPYSGTVVRKVCPGCPDCEGVCRVCGELRFSFRPCPCERCEDCDGTGSIITEMGCFGPRSWRSCRTCYGSGRKKR